MQAARGTSLSQDDSSTPDPRTPRRGRVLGLFALVATVLYAADQITKVIAVDRLDGQPDRPLVGDLLMLNLVRNPGAAFSTGTGYTEVLSCIAIGAVLVILFFVRRLGSTLWAVALGFLLAGVAGNLTDRLLREPGPLRGHVIDFLMLPNWPVFNIADICINVAAGLIIVQAFRGIRLDGTREGADEPDHTRTGSDVSDDTAPDARDRAEESS